MFVAEKNEVVEGLKAVQVNICAYRSNKRCDCKYGATEQTAAKHSEVGSGCPEVHAAIAVLSAMTEEEYKRIVRRYERETKRKNEADAANRRIRKIGDKIYGRSIK